MSTPYIDLDKRRLNRLVELHLYERCEVHEITDHQAEAVNPEVVPPAAPAPTRESAWRPL